VSEYAVAVLPVFATSVLQVVPPLVDLSTLYPVMAEPPLSAGAVQVRLICEADTVVAASPVGVDGATARVVADAVLEEGLVPMELIAETLYTYVAPCVSPVSEYDVEALPEFGTIVDQVVPPLVDLSIL
jgi:hypothetical protein